MAFDNLKNGAASSTQPIEPSQGSKEKLLLTTKHARQLFLAYPRNDYDDPEGAIASYVEVLLGYSAGIIQHVTSNKTGIQRRMKFPPRVAELVTACDEAAAYLERTKRFENWGKNDPTLLEGPKVEKPTLDELKAKYGENWGLTPKEPKKTLDTFQAPSWDEITAMYAADPSRIARLTKSRTGIEPPPSRTEPT